jgi:predicted metal-dependent hydrolase
MNKVTQHDVNIIPVRNFDFDFPENLDPMWVPNNPYRAHFLNGVSLTMPYLEPFLCKIMREALQHIDDEQLLKDMRGFIGQEAQHYRCHRRLNERLTKNGHPQFAKIEKKIADSYEHLGGRSMRTRLAYSAGFECMTTGFTNWLIEDRKSLFKNAQADVTSFWLAHMAEECEHKTVAFDVYESLYGAYWPRAIGVIHGSAHVMGLSCIGMFSALRRDSKDSLFRRTWGVLCQLSAIVVKVGPFLVRALGPNYNPRQESDPEWLGQWVSFNEEAGNQGLMPVIDTSSDEMGLPSRSRPSA